MSLPQVLLGTPIPANAFDQVQQKADADSSPKPAQDKAPAPAQSDAAKAYKHIEKSVALLKANWTDISQKGDVKAIGPATQELRAAVTILMDIRNTYDKADLVASMSALESVLESLIIALKENRAKPTELAAFAAQADHLGSLAGLKSDWSTRVATMNVGPATGSKAGGVVHQEIETVTYDSKIFIIDTNYMKEFLGTIELSMEIVKSSSGQVYAKNATGRKAFTDSRAQNSLNCDIVATSFSGNLNGRRYVDVHFDIQVGGPTVTDTSSFKVGLKSDEVNGSGASVEVGGSKSVTTRSAASIQRIYRIESLDKDVETHKWDDKEQKLVRAMTGMNRDELVGRAVDLKGLVLDDDDVGDTWDEFNADWHLYSHS